MLDKYFGFTEIKNEVAVIESLLEHTRIDEQELLLTKELFQSLINEDRHNLDATHLKIIKIRSDSNRVFEHTEEQIIQAHFDYQKQYDFLRIYQRIECISTDILNISNLVTVLNNIGGSMPNDLHSYVIDIIDLIISSHGMFKQALLKYEKEKSSVIKTIHKIVECEKAINEQYFRSLQCLYSIANQNNLKLGDCKAIEHIFITLESLGNKVEQAATSLEWLLIT